MIFLVGIFIYILNWSLNKIKNQEILATNIGIEL